MKKYLKGVYKRKYRVDRRTNGRTDRKLSFHRTFPSWGSNMLDLFKVNITDFRMTFIKRYN